MLPPQCWLQQLDPKFGSPGVVIPSSQPELSLSPLHDILTTRVGLSTLVTTLSAVLFDHYTTAPYIYSLYNASEFSATVYYPSLIVTVELRYDT